MNKTIFTADIGGTNSRFGHFQFKGDEKLVLVEKKWVPTAEYRSFGQLLAKLPSDDFTLAADEADVAVIAGAGPVTGGNHCAPPNIAWDIDLNQERDRLPDMTCLINDFVAQAYACRSPITLGARQILSGRPSPSGVIGVLGAGTGLGKATLVPLPNHGFLALPSEGGHACFPFISQQESAFAEFYQRESLQRHITGNLVVSGQGLRFLHWYLTGNKLDDRQIPALLAAGKAPETLAWAARFHGRICRDYALETLALGGLYITGGVAARSPEILHHDGFREEFLDSPAMENILAQIPVFLIDDQDSGLWGAAFLARQLLSGQVP